MWAKPGRRGTARSFQDIEEMNGIGCWAKLHSDNYLLAALSLASFSILKNNTCHPIVRIITKIFRPMDKTCATVIPNTYQIFVHVDILQRDNVIAQNVHKIIRGKCRFDIRFVSNDYRKIINLH